MIDNQNDIQFLIVIHL